MAHASPQLRQRITDLLMSRSCQTIDFRMGADRVMGAHYAALALSLNGHGTGRLREEVGLTQGGLASYIIEHNIIRVPFENFGVGASSFDAYDRMGIVHECTHAIFDFVRRQPTINALDDEMLAYIAGAAFNLNEGRPFNNASDPLWSAADRVASCLATRPGEQAAPPDAVNELRQAILHTAEYGHLRRNPLLRWRNDGVML